VRVTGVQTEIEADILYMRKVYSPTIVVVAPSRC
jgi:hypothetical protein